MLRTATAAAVIAAITLTACSSDGEGADGDSGDSPPLQIEGAEPGDYVFEFQGGTGIIDVTVDPASDERLQAVESYRESIGAEPVTYYVVELDNTDGADTLEFSNLTIVTDDGEQLEVNAVWQAIGDWDDLVGPDDTEKYNEGIGLYNDHLDDGDLRPGAKGTLYAAAYGAVGEPSRVYYSPYLGEEVEADLVE